MKQLAGFAGLTLTLAGVASLGCGREVQELESRHQESVQVLPADDVIGGYRHTSSASRFAMGRILATRDDGFTEKVVGEEGVFATNPRTGLVTGVPNAVSAVAAKAPLMGSDTHNQAVKSYLISSGLPEEQIANVVAHGFSHTDIDDRSKYVADGYSTVISRAIDGFQIAESFAWVRMNVEQEVVSESVYWPDVPRSALAEAEDLEIVASTTSDLSTAGVDTADGSVVIHHSPGYSTSLKFTVTYDVPTRTSIGVPHHFDRNGSEVVLPAGDFPLSVNK